MTAPGPAIMVTAVGALIGQGLLRSLRNRGTPFRLIGLDRGTNAYGASLCDACYQKPCAETDSFYLKWLRELVEHEGVQLILPGIEEDVFFFHDHRGRMSDWPVRVVLNSPAAIAAGHDKWLLHQVLLDHGLRVIPTTPVGSWEEMLACLGGPPFIAKARRGSGSRGQRVFRSEEEWRLHENLFQSGFIMQKVVGTDDEEYTVGLFGYGDGTASSHCTLRRRLWNGGTWQAEVVATAAGLERCCRSLTAIFQPLGPTNYQFRHDGEHWYLLEINPRISASTAIRAGFGFDEAQLCVDHYLHGVARPCPADLKRGRCQRHVMEHFEFL